MGSFWLVIHSEQNGNIQLMACFNNVHLSVQHINAFNGVGFSSGIGNNDVQSTGAQDSFQKKKKTKNFSLLLQNLSECNMLSSLAHLASRSESYSSLYIFIGLAAKKLKLLFSVIFRAVCNVCA